MGLDCWATQMSDTSLTISQSAASLQTQFGARNPAKVNGLELSTGE